MSLILTNIEKRIKTNIYIYTDIDRPDTELFDINKRSLKKIQHENGKYIAGVIRVLCPISWKHLQDLET